MPTKSSEEHLGSRDIHYHIRRRDYGGLPSTDVDMIEVDWDDEPVLVQELKHCNIGSFSVSGKCRKVFKVARRMNLPLLITVYCFLHFKNGHWYPINADDTVSVDHVQYYLYPGNPRMRVLLPQPKFVSEREYIEFLHKVKGTQPPADLSQFFQHIVVSDDCCTFVPDIVP